ncbi:MAG: PEP-CTERM sorting domain-containing protein [Candidatus Methylumidiphilus sp.]
MKSAFEKLKLHPAARQAAAACVLGGAGLAPASAAVVNLPQRVTAAGIKWSSARNNTAVVATAAGGVQSNAYGISEAFIVDGRNDAFDGAAGIIVNGTAFNQPGGQVDRSTTAAGTFITTITPQTIGGINSRLDYFFSATSPIVRAFGSFTNTTGGTLPLSVAFGGNLGSDSNTTIAASSSGDTTLQASLDRWLISWDNGVLNDVFQTWAFFGPGATAPTYGRWGVAGSVTGYIDRVGETWDLSLAAGQTANLMWFIQLNNSLSAAQTGTSTFNNISSLQAAGLLSGLSAGDLANTANWVATTSVPEPASLALFGIGGLGAFAARRRRGENKQK